MSQGARLEEKFVVPPSGGIQQHGLYIRNRLKAELQTRLPEFNETRFPQAKEVGGVIVLPMPDDDVIEYFDTHNFAGTNQLFGDFDIF